MNPLLFTSLIEVIGGLFVGMLFGAFLRKAGVTRVATIVRQFLFKDFTVMKVIMTAIATGSFCIYGGQLIFGAQPLVINTTTLFAALAGGLIFGIGMVLLGLCPGTCIGALAGGRRDIWLGAVGMIFGTAIYAELYPWITRTIKPLDKSTQITLSDFFKIPSWVFVLSLLVLILLGFLFEKAWLAKRRRSIISQPE